MLTGGTAAATRQGNPLVSNSVMARVPLWPRVTQSQNRSRPTPKGETTPIPLMTTLTREEDIVVAPRPARYAAAASTPIICPS